MRSGKDTVEDSGVSEAERTRISSAKLLSSPSRALTASKSNTNCARQQAQRDGDAHLMAAAGGSCRAHLRERGLSSLVRCLQRGEDPACGQDRVRIIVRVRVNKKVSRQAPGASGTPGVLIPRPGAE